MPTSCVVCKGSSQCTRCHNSDLMKKIELLQYELSYLRKGSNKQLMLQKDYSSRFETDNKFLPIRYYGLMTEYSFLTITFDPNKFGLFNQPKDEQNYIFYILAKSISDSYINQLTGCFEYQKNGTVHAHIIIKSIYTCSQIEDYFRPFFTDDPKNKYAIKCYKLIKDKCEDYLQKEATEYFRYDKLNNLDDGIGEADESELFKQEVIPIEVQQFTQLMETYKQQQLIEFKKFEKRMSTKYNLNLER